MGDGRRSDKVMLPEAMMGDEPELRRWLTRAFEAAAKLPPKEKKPAKQAATQGAAKKPAAKKPAAKKPAAKKPAAKKPAAKKRR
jgi:hypothetical protein